MGSLHETNPSYWVTSTEDRCITSSTPPESVDVCVVGAGITGLLTAHLLLKQGLSVAVIEAGSVSSGVTGYTTGKVTSQHGARYQHLVAKHGEETARLYGQAQQEGVALIKELARGIDCESADAPAYVFTEDEDRVDELKQEAEVAVSLGLPATYVTDIDLPFPVRGAVRFGDQAWFHPRLFCLGLAEMIQREGGTVTEGMRALDVEGNGPYRVKVDDGEIEARAVVLASHAPFIDSGLFFARTRPMRSYVIAAEREVAFDGMYISLEQPTRSIRPHYASSGPLLLIAGGGHVAGREGRDGASYDDLRNYASERFDIEEASWQWSSQDLEPADGLPFIGPISDRRPNLYLATGFDKWGLSNAAAAARVISHDIEGRPHPFGRVTDARRWDLARSAGVVLSQGAATVKSLVVDGLGMLLSLDGPQSLAPGDAAIVTAGKERVAAYRDEDGDLHAVSPRCTHLGCIVAFNHGEKTWDCPCHGSRFGLDGRVLEGPATEPLERFEVSSADGVTNAPNPTGR